MAQEISFSWAKQRHIPENGKKGNLVIDRVLLGVKGECSGLSFIAHLRQSWRKMIVILFHKSQNENNESLSAC